MTCSLRESAQPGNAVTPTGLSTGARPGEELTKRSMQICVLKSKIHRATITGACLDYEGSLTIAEDLMQQVGLLPYERVLCSNLANGARFETYAIQGEARSGAIILNGAAAHLGQPGHLITIMNYAWVDEAAAKTWHPRVIRLGEQNRIVST